MQKVHPLDYDFFPKTWLLPKDQKKFKAYCENRLQIKKSIPHFICKPDHMSQGKGIFMTRSVDEIINHAD